MPFRYIGDDARVYPDLSLEVVPGQVVDLVGDAPADGRWEPTDEPVTVAADEVAAEPVAPEIPDPDPAAHDAEHEPAPDAAEPPAAPTDAPEES